MTVAERLLVGDEWRPAAGGAEFETWDPATGRLLASCAEAGQADIDAAVDAARTALVSAESAGMLPAQRAKLLGRVAELIERDADALAELETRDQGQLLSIARGANVAAAAEHFRYFAGWMTKIEGTVTPISFPNTRRESVGVCALITRGTSR